jgi:hypothetical protein
MVYVFGFTFLFSNSLVEIFVFPGQEGLFYVIIRRVCVRWTVWNGEELNNNKTFKHH